MRVVCVAKAVRGVGGTEQMQSSACHELFASSPCHAAFLLWHSGNMYVVCVAMLHLRGWPLAWAVAVEGWVEVGQPAC